jgi:hypothetical protein
MLLPMSFSVFMAWCSLIPGAWGRWRENALYTAIDRNDLVLARALLGKTRPNVVFAPRAVPLGKVALALHPLSMTMRRRQLEMFFLLLEHGADPNDDKFPFMGVMTTWLVMSTFSKDPDPLWQHMGVLLLEYGGDIERGLSPEGSSTVRHVLEGTGRMEYVNQVKVDYENARIRKATCRASCIGSLVRL